MTLLAPWALWFSAVGLAVAALYLLKIKRRRQVVPALEFWRELAGPAPLRSLFQRLKRWLSMLLWLVIAACLVLSLGNPVLTLGKVSPRSMAIILDNSASMQAIESDSDNRTRFDLAKEALAELTTLRPVDDDWLLIEAAQRPSVVQPWTRNGRDVRERAAELAPFAGIGDPVAAHELARQLLAGKPSPLIVFLSDGAAEKLTPLVHKEAGPDPAAEDPDADPERIETVLWPIGATRDNLGITQLSVRVDSQRTAHHAYVSVINASDEEVESRIIFELDGSTIDVQPLTVSPGGSWSKTLSLTAPEGGVLRAWIDRPDALAIDNEAFAVVRPIRAARVLLVSSVNEAYFFEQALVAMEPLVDLEHSRTITIAEFDAAVQSNSGALAESDLIIFNNARPESLPPSGAFVCVNVWPKEVPARIVGEVSAPALSIADHNHALTQYLSVGGSQLVRAHEVDLQERATVLIDTAGGWPLVFLVRQPDRQVLCLAFSMLETDMPFRNAFPVFLRNAVSHLVTERSAWLRDRHGIGETIVPLRSLPTGVTDVRVASMSRNQTDETVVAVDGSTFRFDRTTAPGPLRFAIGDEFAYTAVNLTDAAESQIAAAAISFDPRQRLGLSGRLFGTVPWIALAAAATLLLACEWLTYHFRWTE